MKINDQWKAAPIKQLVEESHKKLNLSLIEEFINQSVCPCARGTPIKALAIGQHPC